MSHCPHPPVSSEKLHQVSLAQALLAARPLLAELTVPPSSEQAVSYPAGASAVPPASRIFPLRTARQKCQSQSLLACSSSGLVGTTATSLALRFSWRGLRRGRPGERTDPPKRSPACLPVPAWISTLGTPAPPARPYERAHTCLKAHSSSPSTSASSRRCPVEGGSAGKEAGTEDVVPRGGFKGVDSFITTIQ